jgi:polyisoprenoid-binding protein YceI
MLCAACLPAQETAWQLDPSKTSVEYALGATLHTVHGTFNVKRGDLRFDPQTGRAGGEMVVDAKSGNSGNDSRDAKMNHEILQSDKYPDIVLRPDHIEGRVSWQSVFQVQVHGTFEVHGAAHEVTLPMQVTPVNGEFQVAAQFEVPYQKWGMKNPSTFILRVEDKVNITIHAVLKPVR